MPRIRTIKPEAFKDEELWFLEQETGFPIFRAFVGLWCASDREGRFEWRPLMLKSEILPYWDGDFSRVLDALSTRGFIVKYGDGTREYGLVSNFKRHQIVNNRESDSSLPDPDECTIFSDTSTRAQRVLDACSTRQVHAQAEQERKGKEQVNKSKLENVRQVFSYWVEQTWCGKGPEPKLDDKRKHYIESRLKDFSVDDLKQAIDGCVKSPWHNGSDPKSKGKKYQSIGLIFRDREKVEEFIQISLIPRDARMTSTHEPEEPYFDNELFGKPDPV